MTNYGCYNAERKDSYFVHIRNYDGSTYTFKMREIKDESSRECRYDFRETDKQCEGCLK